MPDNLGAVTRTSDIRLLPLLATLSATLETTFPVVAALFEACSAVVEPIVPEPTDVSTPPEEKPPVIASVTPVVKPAINAANAGSPPSI